MELGEGIVDRCGCRLSFLVRDWGEAEEVHDGCWDGDESAAGVRWEDLGNAHVGDGLGVGREGDVTISGSFGECGAEVGGGGQSQAGLFGLGGCGLDNCRMDKHEEGPTSSAVVRECLFKDGDGAHSH